MIAVLIAATIVLAIWFALDVDGYGVRGSERPGRDIVMFVLAAGAAVLALRRTAAAGVLLVILGAVPVAIAGLGSLEDIGPGIVFAMPIVAGSCSCSRRTCRVARSAPASGRIAGRSRPDGRYPAAPGAA